jgi:hypothetical protein
LRTPPRKLSASAEPRPEIPLIRDLEALLTDDAAIYICLESEGAVLSIKSPEMVAFGKAILCDWRRMSPEDRAVKVVQWIHEAARYRRRPRIRWAPPA